MFGAATIEDLDEPLARALQNERRRQEQYLELIASENYVSPRVLAAQGAKEIERVRLQVLAMCAQFPVYGATDL